VILGAAVSGGATWRRQSTSLAGLLAAVAVAAVPGPALATPPAVYGGLTLLGCIKDPSATLTTACATTTNGLNEASAVAVVGQNVYVAASGGGSFPNGSDIASFSAGPDGSLTALGCIMEPGSNAGCADMANGLNTPEALAATPANVYVASLNSGAVTTLNRLPAGTLSAGSCVADSSSSEICSTIGHALGIPNALALAPDGQNVYVASTSDSAVATLVPGAGGALEFTGCIKEPTSSATCSENGEGLHSARGVAVSGSNVYVADPFTAGNAVAVLNRGAGGALTFGSCIKDPSSGQSCPTTAAGLQFANDVAASPDGMNVYVAAENTLAVFNRSSADGSLTAAGCFEAPSSSMGCAGSAPGLTIDGRITVSADGNNVYVTGGNITVFTRDPSTGALTPAGCLDQNGSGTCKATADTFSIRQIAISPGGQFAYGADSFGDVAWFARELPPACSAQSVQVPFGSSAQIQLACSDANGDPVTLSATSAPGHGTLSEIDQQHAQVTYTPTPGYAGADQFTFAASDGALSSSQTVTLTDQPATASVAPDPVVRSFAVAPKRFAIARGATAISARRKPAPRGAVLRYVLSEAGILRIKVALQSAGRRVGASCLPDSRKRRHRPRCTRYVNKGTLTRNVAAGAGTTRFTGRIGTRRLVLGRYRATAVETTPRALHASAGRAARFTIVAR
jgi:hypothetical protein